MIKKSINLTLFAIVMMIGCKLNSQVTGIKMKLVFNDTTCNYDGYIHIISGTSITPLQRAQFNSSYSVVAKTGLILDVVKTYMPLKNNQLYNGTEPYDWDFNSTIISPAAQPQNDFYYLTTTTLGTYYDNLYPGDSVRLFSLKVFNPTNTCGQDLRLYINGVDPDSGDPGMNSADFSQGFTIGGGAQDYQGNLDQIYPSVPTPEADILCDVTGIKVDLVPVDTSCHSPFSYTWTGPGISGSSSTEDLTINNNNAGNNGTYTLLVSDALGCTASFQYNLENNPNAGNNTSTCSGTTVTLNGSGADGTWTQVNSGNPSGATINSPNNPTTTVDFSSTANGTYKFYYEGINCTDSVEVSVSIHDAGPNPGFVNCYEDGTATLNASGTGTWTLDPSNPGIAIIANSNSASTTVSGFPIDGTYLVNWINGSCSEQISINVGASCACPIANNNINDPSTLTFCNQSTNITLTGTIPTPAGGTYRWEYSTDGVSYTPASGVNNTATYNTGVLPVGEHYFTRVYSTTSGIICDFLSNNVVITIYDNPVVTIDAIDPMCENAGSMNLSGFPGGGTYSGSSGVHPTTGVFSSSDAGVGNHTITYSYTDNNNCSNTASTSIEVKAKPNTPIVSNDGPKCIGETINITSNLIANADYSWTGPNGFVSSDQNPELLGVSELKAGDYKLTVEVDGCFSDEAITTVGVKTIPDAPGIANDGPKCEGEDINLTAETITNAIYFWSGPNGFTTANNNIQNPILTNIDPTDAGEYRAWVTIDGCISSESTTIVAVKVKPSTPIANNDSPKCPGDLINLTASDITNSTYQWYGPGFIANSQNTTIPNVTSANVGTYKVISILDGCNSDTASTIVTVKPTPATPTPTNNGPVCQADTLQLNTTFIAGAIYLWSGPDAFTSAIHNPSIDFMTSAKAGDYKVKVTVDGCESAEGTTTVVVKAKPSLPTASNDGPKCIGEDITLSTPNVPGASYSWRGLATMFTDTVREPKLLNVTPLNDGEYWVKVIINGCESDEAQTTVIVKPKPTTPIVSNDSPKCTGENITLSTPEVVGATYIWKGPNGFNRTEITNTTVIASTNATHAGEYKLWISVGGCLSDSATTTVVIKATPAAPIVSNDGPKCEGETITLSTTLVANATYEWSSLVNGFNRTEQNPQLINATPSLNGVYKLKIEVDGCESTEASTTITVKPKPATPTVSNNGPKCIGEDITLSTLSVSGATYAWTGPNPYTEQNPTINNATLLDNGVYKLKIIVNGCESEEASTTVTINDKPSVTLAQVDPICEDGSIVALVGSPIGGTYSGLGVDLNTFDPSVAQAGNHAITYFFTDGNNCSNEDIIYIEVGEKPTVNISSIGQLCEDGIDVPLFATPNGGEFSGIGVDIPSQTFKTSSLSPGTYIITYNYSDNVCSAEGSIDVEIRANPIVTLDEVGQICFDANSITLTGNPLGGSFIGAGMNQEEFTPNQAGIGNHTINYSYADGNCVGNATIDIEVTPVPVVGIDAVSELCIDGGDVQLTAFPQGGTFSGNAITADGLFSPSSVSSGDHTITYTFDDNLGCVVEATTIITVKAKPNVTINNIPDVCETETEITLIGNPINGTFSGNGFITGDKFDVSNAGVGNYTVTYNFNDGVCSNETTSTFNVIAKPVITIDEVGQICKDADAITLSAIPVNGTFSGDGIESGNKFNPNGLTIGNHLISYTVNAGACTSTESISIEVTPAPVVVIDAISDVCFDGNSTTLSATPVGVIFTGNGVSGNTFTPSNAGVGNHIITGRIDDGLGCIVESTITASVKAKPVVTINNIPDVCETETEITLIGNPINGTFSGNGFITGDKFDVSNAGVGNYAVTYNYNDGVCSNETTSTFNVIAKPVISIDEVGQICKDADAITLSATPVNGTFNGDGIETGNKFNPNGLTIGNHLISYTVSAGACTSTESIAIEITPAPVVVIDAISDVCIDGNSTTLSATPVGAIFTGNGVSGNTFIPSNAGVGNHIITGRIDDGLGCIVESTTIASVKAKPVVTINNIPDVCETTTEITLVGNPTAGIFTGNNVINNDKFNVSTAGVGTHTITYIYNDGVCSNSANGTVNVTAEPIINFTEVGQICKDASPITLTATPTIGTFSGDGVVSANQFDPNGLTIGNHTVSYTVTAGACTSTESISIEVTPAPIVSIDAINEVCIDGNAITISATPVGVIFSGSGVSGNIITPSIAGVGNHTITGRINDGLGCIVESTTIASVKAKPVVTINNIPDVCETTAEITLVGNPTAGIFTGNNVNNNDKFNVSAAGIGTHPITYIYNDGVCSNSANGTVNVTAEPIINFTEVGQICKDANAILLNATPTGGIFTGNGIISGNRFNPNIVSLGNHEITYTLVSGACTSTEKITIEVVPTPTINIDAVAPLCKDGDVAALNANPIGGLFSGGGVSGIFFDPKAVTVGNHIVTYTYNDNLGCIVNENIEINVQDKPIVTIDNVNQLCETGSIINLTSNLSPGTFTGNGIENGNQFNPNIANAGNHTITYNYSNGVCANASTINIEVMEQVNAGNDVNLNCVVLNSASYILQATGNGNWKQLSNTPVIFDNKNISNPRIDGFSQAGTYTFEYSNGACKDEVSVIVSAKPNAGNDASTVKCFATGATALSAVGFGTWSLTSNSAGTVNFDINNPSTQVNNFEKEGEYYFVWTVDGCTDTVSINVGKDCDCPIENNLITSSDPKDFCETTGNIVLDGGNVSLPGDYVWQYSFNNALFTNATGLNNSRTYNVSNLGIGNHRFKRIYNTTSGVICADTSNIIELNVNAKPLAVTVSSNSPVCSGDELNITAQAVAGTSYKWIDPNGTEYATREITIPSATNFNEGLYRLFITKDNCNSDEITLIVVVNDKPTAPSIDPISAVCEGDILSFNTSTIASDYEWSLNGNKVSDQKSFDVLSADLFDAGNYTLSVTNDGCESDPTQVVVVVNSKPATPILNSNSPVCEGQDINIVFVNGVSGLQYNWITPSLPTNTKDISIPNANSSHEGNYTLFVTKDGCESESTTIFVEVSAKFNAPSILGDLTVCEGEDLQLTSDATGATFEWTLPNGNPSALQTLSFSSVNKATHEGEYKLKIYKDGCESETSSVNVVVNNNPATPSIDPIPAICEGESLSFNTSTMADSYEWTFNSIVKDTNKSFDIPSASTNDEGVYSLVVTVNDCKSQPATVNTIINEIPAKPILSSNSPVCEGQAISIILTNNVPGLSYDWTIPGGGKLTSRDINIASANVSHAGDYTLTVTKDNCVSEPTTINVEVSNKFSAPIILGDKEICEGQSTTLSTSADATAYEWVTPKGIFNSSTIEITNASSSDVGNYTLKISKDGCESEIGNSTVIVNSKPLAPAIDPVTPVCEGETLSFNTSIIADTYSWKVNGIEVSDRNTFEITDADINDAVNYTLTVTKNGCESNPSNITAIVKETPAKPTINSNSPVCEGQTISIVHTNSEVGYSHFWTTPNGSPTTKDISIASANASHKGDYVLYVEKDGCRSEATTITVDVSDKSQAPTIVGQLEICEGQPINLSTNNAADTYVWTLPNNSTSNGATIDITNATAANAGTYKLEIEKDGCKSETQEVIVSINAKLSAPSIDPVAAVCEGEDIVITAELLAGATYSWTGPNNFTGQTHTINNAKLSDEGIYTLIVDKDGCKSEAATITVDVKESPAKPTINSNSPVCEGQSISIVHTNNEVGVNHFWVMPGGDEVSTKDINITTANSSHEGNYVLYVEKDGCKSEATTITVEVSDKSQAPTIVGQLEICEGQSINLSTSNAADSYVWTLPNNSTITDATIDIAIATAANAGTYKLEIEKDGCKSETQEVIVTINAKLSAPLIESINAVCEGEDVILTTNTTADSYEWTFNGNKIPGSNTLTITNSDLNDVGTYSLSITKAGCKSENATINVEVKEKPEAAILNDSKVCEGTQLTITNSNPVNGVTYEWTLPNGTKVTDPTILIISSSESNEGTYSLILSKDGCKSESESMLLTVNELPETTINGDLEYCEGERISLVSSNTSSLSYNWSGPANMEETTSTIAINNADVSNSGTYSIQVTNIVTGCISSTVEVEVTVNAKPSAPTISAEEEICAGKEIVLIAEEITNAEYSWKGPDGFNSDVRNPIITKATEDMGGEYELIITVNGCPSEPVTLAIAIKNCSCNIAENEITSDLAAFCNESGAFTIEATTPTPADGKFEWQYKDDKSEYAPAIGVNDLPNYDVANLGLGKHFFRRIYIIENEGYVCTDTTETLELNVLDNSTDYIDLFLDPKTPCVGDTMMIMIENEIPGVAYTWTVIEDNMSIVSSNNRLAQFSPDKPGQYHIHVTQQVPGCDESDPLVQEINVNANPRANLGHDTVFCHLDGDFEIKLKEEYTSYLWSDGSENSSLIIDEKGSYTVTVTDENGCEAVDEVRIKEFCCKVFYPNIINMQDGSVRNNEFRLVDNGCVLTSKLRIYDRWGNLVYVSDRGLEPWDGRFSGKVVDQGVYAFIFTYTALDEDDQEFEGKVKGDVTILR